MYQEIWEEVLEMYSRFQDQVKQFRKWLYNKGKGGGESSGVIVIGWFAVWSSFKSKRI